MSANWRDQAGGAKSDQQVGQTGAKSEQQMGHQPGAKSGQQVGQPGAKSDQHVGQPGTKSDQQTGHQPGAKSDQQVGQPGAKSDQQMGHQPGAKSEPASRGNNDDEPWAASQCAEGHNHSSASPAAHSPGQVLGVGYLWLRSHAATAYLALMDGLGGHVVRRPFFVV